MKKAVILGLMLACLLMTSVAIADTGVAGIWHFDEGSGSIAYDSSGNGNNGTINGATWTNDCISVSCLKFNGVNSYVQVPDSSSLEITGSITVEFWMKPAINLTSTTPLEQLSDKGDSYGFDLSNGVGGKMQFYVVQDGINKNVPSTNDFWAANTWYFVVGTYDGGNLNLYVNGILNNTVPLTGSIESGGYPLAIGSHTLGTSSFFNGTIDEFSIYNYAKTPSEILNDYENQVPKAVGIWHFDEGNGTIAHDSSGNGNNGTLQGNPIWESGTDCISGSCLQFNGLTDYITVYNSGNLDITQNITLEGWAYRNSNANGEIISKNGPYELAIANNNVKGAIYNGGQWAFAYGNTTLQLNKWYHLAMTYDGSKIKVYVNGQLDGSTPQSGLMPVVSQGIYIGYGEPGINYFFNGMLDELSIYNYAKTDSEILSDYQEYASPKCGDNITEDTVLDHDLLNCPGNGLVIDADNITLDCNGHSIIGNQVGYGIYLTGRTNVSIKNCMITNFWSGIWLNSSSNNIIKNNTVSSDGYTSGYGIWLDSFSNNNILTNNTANSDGHGIIVTYSSGNNFTNNTANSNYYEGIYITYSSNSTLINNTANSNGNSGIRILYSSNSIITENNLWGNVNYGISLGYSTNNIVVGNNATNSNYGIVIEFSPYNNSVIGNQVTNNWFSGIGIWYSYNSSIYGNNITNNYYGIWLGSSKYINISGNYITNNSQYGISIEDNDDNNNIVYNNYLNNTVNAKEGSATLQNYWNTTKTLGTNIIGGPYVGGNYWGDYNGVDSNWDGIGDTQLPYNSNENIPNGGDYLPLTTVNVVKPPNITISYPQTNISYSKINVILLFTVDRNTSWMGYSLNNRSNITVTSLPIFLTSYSGLSNGWNSLAIYANDTYGVMGSNTTKFFYCLGDLTGITPWVPDKKVDIRDVNLVAKLYGAVYGDPNPNAPKYDVRADLNNDGKIDINDVHIVAVQYGTNCS